MLTEVLDSSCDVTGYEFFASVTRVAPQGKKLALLTTWEQNDGGGDDV